MCRASSDRRQRGHCSGAGSGPALPLSLVPFLLRASVTCYSWCLHLYSTLESRMKYTSLLTGKLAAYVHLMPRLNVSRSLCSKPLIWSYRPTLKLRADSLGFIVPDNRSPGHLGVQSPTTGSPGHLRSSVPDNRAPRTPLIFSLPVSQREHSNLVGGNSHYPQMSLP